jgi:hypothetical protein
VIFIAYLSFVAAVMWLTSERSTWLTRQSTGIELVTRCAAAAAALSLSVAGAALVAFGDVEAARAVIGGTLLLGGLTFTAGLLAWGRQPGLQARTAGWILLCAPLLIPSTLSLALPLVALLVVAVPGTSSPPLGRDRRTPITNRWRD